MVFRQLRGAFLADSPSGSIKFALEGSFSLRDGVARLRAHRFRALDLQYVLLIPLLLFCFIICEKPSPLVRLAIALALLYACLVPALSQFWRHFLPTGAWLILFYSCRYIPPAWRPSIYVRVLPGLEAILYGGNLSEVLASSPTSAQDIMAWLPYGLAHYGAPFVVSLLFFLFGPPYFLRSFMFAFGYMNIIGLLVQILFPNAPPWYRIIHGLEKANYGMPGSAGGLARVDEIIGFKLYGDSFGASPQVFGAFPSLHSGSAVMEALFMADLFPRAAPIFTAYVMWIWWSTMYLTHHYFVDLIGGAVLSLTVYYLVAMTIKPRVQPGKFGRWSYDHVEFGLKPALPKTQHAAAFDEEAIFDMRRDSPELPAEAPAPEVHEVHEVHELHELRPGTPRAELSRPATPKRMPSPRRER